MRSLVLAPLLVVAALAVTTGTAAAAPPAPIQAAAPSPVQAAPSAAPKPGGVGIRLMDVPVDAATDPRAQLYTSTTCSPEQ